VTGDDAGAGRGSLSSALSRATAATTFLLSVGLASWWLVGDRSVVHQEPDDLDYLYRVPELPGWATAIAGLGGVALALATGRPLLGARATRRPAAVLLVAGVTYGFMARVVTAGVIGANIGGGMALLFGLPLVTALALGALLSLTRASPSAKL
jgi:hypothetical protein